MTTLDEQPPFTAVDLVHMRNRFHEVCDLTVEAEQSVAWNAVWASAQRVAANRLQMDPSDDERFSTMRNIEKIAAAYRRHICDPIQLVMSSVPAQARLGTKWDAILASLHDDVTTDMLRGPVISTEWSLVVTHGDWFEGWDTQSTVCANDARWFWRPACNLYATPHNLMHPQTVETACFVARWLLSMAAACETTHLLQEPCPDTLPVTQEEWCQYRSSVWKQHGGWWDMEKVAVERCGYPKAPVSDVHDPCCASVWRSPIHTAEQHMMQCIGSLKGNHPIREPVVRWLHEVCGVGESYLHIRWPPAFIAVMADCFAEAVSEQTESVQEGDWDIDIIERTTEDSTMHPMQSYSLWCMAGMKHHPTEDCLTRGWTGAERDTLTAAEGILTADLLRYWRNRPHNV